MRSFRGISYYVRVRGYRSCTQCGSGRRIAFVWLHVWNQFLYRFSIKGIPVKHRVFIFTRLDAFLSAILDQARNGYLRYTIGTCAASKVFALVNKFELMYLTGADKNQRFRQRQSGIAPARLQLYERAQGEPLIWVLLVHEHGENPAQKLEKLICLEDRKTRLEIAGLELVRRDDAGKLRWTWQMTSDLEQTFRARIIHAIRARDHRELSAVQHELWRLPGFNRVRHQVGKAAALARNEWARTRRNNEPWPGWPTFLRYVKKQAAKDCGRVLIKTL